MISIIIIYCLYNHENNDNTPKKNLLCQTIDDEKSKRFSETYFEGLCDNEFVQELMCIYEKNKNNVKEKTPLSSLTKNSSYGDLTPMKYR